MHWGVPEQYLLVVNLVGALLFGVNQWLRSHTKNGRIDVVLTLMAIIGGAPAVLLLMILFDRRVTKENVMQRVIAVCALVMQVILYLMLRVRSGGALNFAIWEFFAARKWLLWYLLGINVAALAAFGIDKLQAIRQKRRIRIVTLLALAFAGGSLGALAGMYGFRHKTQKDYFTVGVPLMLMMQVLIVFFWMNL